MLTTINTVESREWAGKIKHHRDPKGHQLKKPTLMSSNYVFMKAANTELTGGKRLNWTGSLRVRDMTITVWTFYLTVPVQLFHTVCVSASYSFTFQVLVRTSSDGCSNCTDCETFLIWPWLWKGKERCPWAVGEYEEKALYFFSEHSFHSFISFPILLPPLPLLTTVHASNWLQKEYLSILQLQMSTH